MDIPFFAIVLPTYNVADHIERCIASLINQSFKNFEMIFVDDCGQDNSISLIQPYQKNDNRIRIISGDKNRGTYHARRLGVEQARGEYVVFVDPDDELERDFLATLHNHLLTNPSDIIFYKVSIAPKKKWYQSSLNSLPKPNKSQLLEATFQRRLFSYKTITYGTLGKAYRREFIASIYNELAIDPEFRFVFAEDNLVFFTAALKNPNYSVLPIAGYRYHLNETSITNIAQSKTDVSFITKQVQFSIKKTKKMIALSDITKKEKNFFDYFFGRHTESGFSFVQRFEDDGSKYLYHLWKAFLHLPNPKLLARMVIYFGSFGTIKL